jgi:hypothetical protein
LASSLDSLSKNDSVKSENMDSLLVCGGGGGAVDVELFLERTGVGSVGGDVLTLSCDDGSGLTVDDSED